MTSTTSAPLLAFAPYSEALCKAQSSVFFECKEKALGHPSECGAAAKAVTLCSEDSMALLAKTCPDDAIRWWTCLDHQNQRVQYCRKEELQFARCAHAKLGVGAEHLATLESGNLASWRKQ